MNKEILLHFEAVSWMTDNPLVRHYGYDIIPYHTGMNEYINILKEIIGDDEFKKSIINELKNSEDIKIFDDINGESRYNFYVRFNFILDEETKFYLKLKYNEWFDSFSKSLCYYPN